MLAQLGDEGGKQEIVAAAIGAAWIGKPALGWIENQVRIAGEARRQGHGGSDQQIEDGHGVVAEDVDHLDHDVVRARLIKYVSV